MGTIAGDLTLSLKYNCGHYQNVDIIAKIRLWALSDCGDHRNVGTIPGIRLLAQERETGGGDRSHQLVESEVGPGRHRRIKSATLSTVGHYRTVVAIAHITGNWAWEAGIGCGNVKLDVGS